MTHLPYIVGSYALALLIPSGFAIAAARRMRLVAHRLAAIDPRRGRARSGV